ncbi:NAD(P)-dependent oxidoreductase [Pseudomonas fluorescens]|nr:NAD(P)-dependent oxidoreductase [Pseudomonas fluorescens]
MSENKPNTQSIAVGFVGLGDQGLLMAAAIARAGHDLHVWARNPEHYTGLKGAAFTRHDSIESLAAASEVVGLCISSDDDVIQLLRNGLLQHLRKGAIVINHGTGTPAKAKEIAEICAKGGVEALDAPVSGGRPAAEECRLTTYVGGAKAVAKQCLPVFQSFSRHVQYMGATGAGQYAKLFNNTLMIMNQAAIADVLDLASRCGLDPRKTVEALKLGSAFSNSLTYFNTMITEQTVGHLSRLEEEDMDLFAVAMADVGIDGSIVYERGIAGARGIAKTIQLLNS